MVDIKSIIRISLLQSPTILARVARTRVGTIRFRSFSLRGHRSMATFTMAKHTGNSIVISMISTVIVAPMK